MQTISSPYYGYLCFFFSHVSFTNTADCGIHIRTYEGEIHSSGHRTVSWTFIQIAIVYLQLTMCYTITSLHAIRLSFYVAWNFFCSFFVWKFYCKLCEIIINNYRLASRRERHCDFSLSLSNFLWAFVKGFMNSFEVFYCFEASF